MLVKTIARSITVHVLTIMSWPPHSPPTYQSQSLHRRRHPSTIVIMLDVARPPPPPLLVVIIVSVQEHRHHREIIIMEGCPVFAGSCRAPPTRRRSGRSSRRTRATPVQQRPKGEDHVEEQRRHQVQVRDPPRLTGRAVRTRRSTRPPVRARGADGRLGRADGRPTGGRAHGALPPRQLRVVLLPVLLGSGDDLLRRMRPASISWKVWPIVWSIVGDDQSGYSVRPPDSTSASQPALTSLPSWSAARPSCPSPPGPAPCRPAPAPRRVR